MDTVARKWHVLILLLCTPFLHCVELCAQPYVEPASEFVVADTAATEVAPRVGGSVVTWSAKPESGKYDVYYRALLDGSSLFAIVILIYLLKHSLKN